jgi:hypothetical protein
MKWTKGGGKVLAGLVRRRQAESAWWLSHEMVPMTAAAAAEVAEADDQEQRLTPDDVPVPSMATSSQGNAAIITAGLGGLGMAKQVAANAQDASDTANQIMGLLGNTNFLIMLAIVGLGGAIWWFRKQHMEEHGV